jgi:hypothetical protein
MFCGNSSKAKRRLPSPCFSSSLSPKPLRRHRRLLGLYASAPRTSSRCRSNASTPATGDLGEQRGRSTTMRTTRAEGNNIGPYPNEEAARKLI